MQKRSLLVQVLLDMATGGSARLEALIVDRAGTFDAGMNKGYNPVTVPSGSVNVIGEKSVVENHSVVVTPKAQVSSGWVTGGTLEGSEVGVAASELVSGTYDISQAGTSDVTNYKDVSVNAGGTTSYLERTAIDEHSVRLTPKADITSGWQDNKTVVGDSIDVDASGLVSGTYPVTASGEFDVTTYEKISVPSGVVSASAIKGVVANHSVLITPSATRTAGFISSGETTGQDIRVDASELVSGTLNVSQPGDIDVTNYAEVSVPSGGHSASGVKGAVSNHSISVTPISTATAGFVSGGDVSGMPVSVSASELVSGSMTITDNSTYDVTNLQTIIANVSSEIEVLEPIRFTYSGTNRSISFLNVDTFKVGVVYSPSRASSHIKFVLLKYSTNDTPALYAYLGDGQDATRYVTTSVYSDNRLVISADGYGIYFDISSGNYMLYRLA